MPVLTDDLCNCVDVIYGTLRSKPQVPTRCFYQMLKNLWSELFLCHPGKAYPAKQEEFPHTPSLCQRKLLFVNFQDQCSCNSPSPQAPQTQNGIPECPIHRSLRSKQDGRRPRCLTFKWKWLSLLLTGLLPEAKGKLNWHTYFLD